MAYALKFDGATNRISLSAAIANPLPIGESITFNGKWKNSGKTFQMFIDLYTSGSDFIGFNTSGQLYTRISNNIKVGTLALTENQEFEFVISRTPSQYDLTLNGVFQYSHLKITNLATLDGFSNQTYDFEGEMYDCTVGTTNLYDATASNHAPGAVTLTDTVGGNDGIGQNFPTDGSAWIDLGGGGVTVAVTETLNSFIDSSVINIDYNVSAIITEVLQPFSDSSSATITPKVSITATVTETLSSFSDNSVITIDEAGSVAVNVTETLSAFKDSSVIDVSANIGVLVTEVLNSFLDGSNVTISKNITAGVTEVLSSFSDNSFSRLPVIWVDKPVTVTNYTTQAPVTTNWTDKG